MSTNLAAEAMLVDVAKSIGVSSWANESCLIISSNGAIKLSERI